MCVYVCVCVSVCVAVGMRVRLTTPFLLVHVCVCVCVRVCVCGSWNEGTSEPEILDACLPTTSHKSGHTCRLILGQFAGVVFSASPGSACRQK